MAPEFEIGLRILNPNAAALELQGIVYTVSVQGFELVKGVGRDFPLIEGYSEEEITLSASANLLTGIRFFGDMMTNQQQSLTYDFEARLDIGGLFSSVEVSESGSIDL
jgi:LEA14-like dessication related protein